MKIDFAGRNFKWLEETTIFNPAGEVLTFYPSVALAPKVYVDQKSAEGELYRGYTLRDEHESMMTERELKTWMAGGQTAVLDCLAKLKAIFEADFLVISRQNVQRMMTAAGVHSQTFDVTVERLIVEGYITESTEGLLAKTERKW